MWLLAIKIMTLVVCLALAGTRNIYASGALEIIAGCETVVSDTGRQNVAKRLADWRQALEMHRVTLEQIGRITEFTAVIEQAETAWRAGDIGTAYDRLTSYPSRQLWRLVEACEYAPRIYVDGVTGDDARTGQGDWTNAVKTISNGVARAGAGGTVLIAPGTYKLTDEIVVDQNITLRSWKDGGLDPENTIIDGQRVTRCMYINHDRARVAGLTLTGGNGVGNINSNAGGAVYIYTRGGMLSHCLVRYNSADLHGGGVYLVNDRGYVEYCRIEGNMVTNEVGARGGGVYMTGGTLRDSILAYNTNLTASAYGGGGGIYIRGGLEPERYRVIGCVISNNQSHGGGGVTLYGSGVLVSNTIIANHSVPGTHGYGGGVFMHGVIEGTVFADNTVDGNTGATHGGGMYIWPSTPAPPARGSVPGGVVVTNCVITDNTASLFGGGIHVFIPSLNYTETRVIVADSDISRNRITSDSNTGQMTGGGGVFWDAPGLMEKCLVADNLADGGAGGGLYVRRTYFVGPDDEPEELIIRNCRIVGNRALRDPGVFRDGDAAEMDDLVRLEECNVSGNEILAADQDRKY